MHTDTHYNYRILDNWCKACVMALFITILFFAWERDNAQTTIKRLTRALKAKRSNIHDKEMFLALKIINVTESYRSWKSHSFTIWQQFFALDNRTNCLMINRFTRFVAVASIRETHEKRAKEIARKEISFQWSMESVFLWFDSLKRNAKHQLSEEWEKNLRSLCDLTVQSFNLASEIELKKIAFVFNIEFDWLHHIMFFSSLN